MKPFLLLLACLVLPVAAAEPATDPAKPAINLDIGTPPVVITKHSIAQRSSRLIRFYEAGEIGLGHDGLIYLRDGVKLSLAKRQIAEKLIDLENTERKTLVFTIADGNGRRDAQPEVWEMMRSRWNQQWKSGWWLRNAEGKWSRKP
jgi:hypothetical protein